MKITRTQLRNIINEEVERLLTENYAGIKPGDYLQVSVSDDGYDMSVDKVDPAEYENTKSFYQSLKVLVRVEQVAVTAEDY